MNTVSQQIAFSSTNPAFTDPVFFAYMDQALAAYSAGNLSMSRAKLNLALPLSRTQTVAYAQYWDCLITANEQLRDSVIDIYTFYEMIRSCSSNQPQSRTAQANNTEQSQPSTVSKEANLLVELKPNPASSTVNVLLNGDTTEEILIEVLDIKGSSRIRQIVPGSNEAKRELIIQIDGLLEGLYLVKVTTAKYMQAQKLVVTR